MVNKKIGDCGIMNNQGFTLVELIMVLAALALIIGIAIPKINIHTYSLKKQAKQLCMDIRELKMLNMCESQEYEILLTEKYYILKKNMEIEKIVDLEKDCLLWYTYNRIKFDHKGNPSYSQTISLKNKDSKKYMEITIVPVTGRVLLKDETFSIP